jgi:hypothetical protein
MSQEWSLQAAAGRLLIPVVLCLTLGLAPFTPEPHIVGKLRWVAGGAVGMALMDWLDLLMHGAPFVLLAAVVAYEVFGMVRSVRDRPRSG